MGDNEQKMDTNVNKKTREIPNVPNLRFKTYTSDWTKYRCSDFLKAYSTNSLSWDKLSYEDSEGVLNLHYGLIHNGAPTLIDTSSYNLPLIIEDMPKSYELCKNGDVIFADASEDTNDICKPVEIYKTSGKSIISGLHTIHTRDYKDLTCVGFKGYLFSSKSFHKQVFRLTQGTKIFSINFSNFREMSVFIPQKEEQRKIVGFLSKIDERISTQSKIIEDLELYKNRIAHQLIYNNPLLDKTTPLKEYAMLKNGYAFKSDKYSESGNYKVITIANVTGNKYISTTDCNSIETLPKDIQSHQILKLGDILISLTGNVGRVSIVNEINCLLNQRVGVLFFTNIQLKKYLFQVLSNKLFETKMVQKGQGAAQKNIGNEDVESFLIPISNNLEYINKITKVLDVLDEKLALEKQILEKLKEQKKFLLSNMFI